MDDIRTDLLTDEEFQQLEDEFYALELDKFLEFVFEHPIDKKNCNCALCELMTSHIYLAREGKIESDDSILDDVSILSFLDSE